MRSTSRVREAKELLIKCGEHKDAETLRLREETAKCGPAAYYCCAEGELIMKNYCRVR
jgi:hypothetical protein